MAIMTFQEALDDSSTYSKRHLLLGNGFSIALRPKIFSYGSLFSQADFTRNPNLPKVFSALDTTDFEVAIKSLESSAALVGIYSSSSGTAKTVMQADADALKEILISTVTRNHPDGPYEISEEEFFHCRQFLSNFISPEIKGHVFTLNYDLLLYWTLMHSEFSDGQSVDLITKDGFGDDDPSVKNDYVTWQGEGSRMSSSVFFMHGALHLFDAGKEVQKFTWIRKDERLKQQSWDAMRSGRFPLFVAEGTTGQKANKIQHSAYLFQCLKTFRACVDTIKTCLFIHGHSLAENDLHIFSEIARGRCQKIYISLHGDPDSSANQEIVRKAEALKDSRSAGYPLDVKYYDAASAAVLD